MRIITKYELGDIVWFMKNNKATAARLSSVTVFKCGTTMDTIVYTAKKVDQSASWLDYEHLHEDVLFLTKYELLESL